MKKVVIFDICGTLFHANTTFDFLEYTFANNINFRCFKCLYKSVLWRLMNRICRQILHIDVTRILALRFLKGYSRSDLQSLAEKYYDLCLEKKQNKDVIAELTNHLHIDLERVIFISATIDVVGQTIARRLGCSECYTTLLTYENGICLGRISKDILGIKDQIVSSLGIKTGISFVYTDDFSDLPLLSLSENKIVVSTYKTENKWKRVLRERNMSATIVRI